MALAREFYEGQKLRGMFTGKENFEDAGGTWDANAMQWVDYWTEADREDPNILHPSADCTLLIVSEGLGQARPATAEDLRRLGYMTEDEWVNSNY